jgi:hypothetical protein
MIERLAAKTLRAARSVGENPSPAGGTDGGCEYRLQELRHRRDPAGVVLLHGELTRSST